MVNLGQKLKPELLAVLHKLSGFAAEQNQELYIVGGFVRDLLLGLEPGDLDLVLVGDAIKFAHGLLRHCEQSEAISILEEHPQFRTVKLQINNTKFEIASARSETYAEPAAFPKVKLVSDINVDLPRRDFTINALLISLNQSSFGDLLDPVDALQDLEHKQIKVFHDKSFVDDPTRILRAQRFAVKYGFEIEAHTQELINQAESHPDFGHWQKKLKNRIKTETEKLG